MATLLDAEAGVLHAGGPGPLQETQSDRGEEKKEAQRQGIRGDATKLFDAHCSMKVPENFLQICRPAKEDRKGTVAVGRASGR